MRIGNMQAAGGRIQEALDELLIAWRNTREHWQDQQAQLFEDKYIRKVSEELSAAFPAMSQISQTFGTASRDCSE